MMELRKDTILITGGTSGIGLEMARQLTEMGNTVIVTGRNPSKLEGVKKELPSVYIYPCDVSNQQEVQSLYHRVTADFPNLNILINNAGIMRAIDFTTADSSHII